MCLMLSAWFLPESSLPQDQRTERVLFRSESCGLPSDTATQDQNNVNGLQRHKNPQLTPVHEAHEEEHQHCAKAKTGLMSPAISKVPHTRTPPKHYPKVLQGHNSTPCSFNPGLKSTESIKGTPTLSMSCGTHFTTLLGQIYSSLLE